MTGRVGRYMLPFPDRRAAGRLRRGGRALRDQVGHVALLRVAVDDYGDGVALLHAAIYERLDRLTVARMRTVEILRREALPRAFGFVEVIGKCGCGEPIAVVGVAGRRKDGDSKNDGGSRAHRCPDRMSMRRQAPTGHGAAVDIDTEELAVL